MENTKPIGFDFNTAIATLKRYRNSPDLPDPQEWLDFEAAEVSFSRYHFKGASGFSLPFYPEDYVYSPAVDLPIQADAQACSAHYKRGVDKYRRMIARGEPLPLLKHVQT